MSKGMLKLSFDKTKQRKFLNPKMKERNLWKSAPIFTDIEKKEEEIPTLPRSQSVPFFHTWEFFPDLPSARSFGFSLI